MGTVVVPRNRIAPDGTAHVPGQYDAYMQNSFMPNQDFAASASMPIPGVNAPRGNGMGAGFGSGQDSVFGRAAQQWLQQNYPEGLLSQVPGTGAGAPPPPPPGAGYTPPPFSSAFQPNGNFGAMAQQLAGQRAQLPQQQPMAQMMPGARRGGFMRGGGK